MKLDNKGLSLAEIVIASGLLGVLVYTFVGGQKVFKDASKKSRSFVIEYNLAQSLYKKINSNPGVFQVTMNSNKFLKVTSKVDLMEELPLAWNDKLVTSAEECKKCPGRIGYILTPHSEYRGMYNLIIRITHKEYIKTFKDYNFIVAGE